MRSSHHLKATGSRAQRSEMESTEGKVDGVMSEEPNTGEVKKTEEIKIEEVEDNAVAVPVEHSRVPPARMGKLEFKDLPLDVKRLILGYVRREF